MNFRNAYLKQDSQMLLKCKYIGPVIDLIQIENLNFDKSNQNLLTLNTLGARDTVIFIFEKDHGKGEDLVQTSLEPFNIDSFYSFTGQINRRIDEFFLTGLKFEQKDFTNSLIDLCHFWGCNGINLKANFEKYGTFNNPFYIPRNTLSTDFLQTLKLQDMKTASYKTQSEYKFIRYTTYDIEIKADLFYLRVIKNQKGQVDFLSIVKDYLKLRGVYKSLNAFNMFKNNKLFDRMENKIQLIEIGVIKSEMLVNVEDLLLDRLVSDTRHDLKRLKDMYVN